MKILTVAGLAIVAAVATAHVVVRPAEAVAGKEQRYTIRVPNEKKLAMTAIYLDCPPEVAVSGVDEKAGWKIELSKTATGKIIKITWSGSLQPGAVAEFSFTAKNPNRSSEVRWQAVQIYNDGSRSEWTGPSGSRNPASATRYVESATRNSK